MCAQVQVRLPAPVRALNEPERTFEQQYVRFFDAHFARIFRYLDRLSGDPELAADLAQDALLNLYHRGSVPDRPEAWLITVALNLFRNARSSGKRRRTLLTIARAADLQSDAPPSPEGMAAARETRGRVRAAIDGLPERERSMLLLRAEGYSYRDIARALDVNEASVGTLLARAKSAFRAHFEDAADAH